MLVCSPLSASELVTKVRSRTLPLVWVGQSVSDVRIKPR